MNFIRKLWLRIKFIISKKSKLEEVFISNQKAILESSLNGLELLENYNGDQDDISRSLIIDQLAEQASAKTILLLYDENNRFLLDKNHHNYLADLKAELLTLEKRRLILNFTKNVITQVKYVDLSFLDENIQTMRGLETKIGTESRKRNNIRTFENSQSFEKLVNLLKAQSTLNLHKSRLSKRQQLNEIEKSKIKEKLNRLEGAIAQNRLASARGLLSELESEIKPTFYKETARLNQSRQKIKDKELLVIEKAQNELLRKLSEEVLHQKEIENKRLEAIKVEKDKQDYLKKLQVDEKSKEKEKLTRLLAKKENWMDFENVCNENAITQLYHFTDKANIKSIKECGGLYSWHYLQKNNIDISFPGGDTLSRDLDRRYSLEDFVRVSFTTNHPMMFVKFNEKKIINPVILKIAPAVCLLQETMFSDMNATRTGHKSGSKIEDFKRIKFSIVRQPNHFNLGEDEAKYYQAEVMVKTWIPAEFILNIDEF